MNKSSRAVDVIVIGGGQAGLALGWHLQQQGLDFLILDEQTRPGGNWRNYYDSLQLFSPAEYSALPGMVFPGDPQGYPLRDEVVQYGKALDTERLQRKAMFQKVLPDGVLWPDGTAQQADALIFATGFRPNLEVLARLPVADQQGRVLQRNGVADQLPGLYFVGLPKQRNFASATLRGVGADAGYLMPQLLRHLDRVGSTGTPAQQSRNPASDLQGKRASHRRQPS